MWKDRETANNILTNYDYKNMELVSHLYFTSNKLSENNKKRARLKNILNQMYSSQIKNNSHYEEMCYIKIADEFEIYDKISELNYLFISFDLICVDIVYKDIMGTLFPYCNISFIEQDNESQLQTTVLSNCNLTPYEKDIFDFSLFTTVAI
jgi:hypothetical protein